MYDAENDPEAFDTHPEAYALDDHGRRYDSPDDYSAWELERVAENVGSLLDRRATPASPTVREILHDSGRGNRA